jgi:hypothetical protein
MSRTVLFLDIDGVLHPNGIARTYVRRNLQGELVGHRILGDGLWQWSEPLVRILREFPQVQVVLHSTWRHEISLADIKAHMPSELAGRIVALTPTDAFERLDSIRLYCAKNAVERYVIVDDAAGQFPKGLPELVLCGENGLGDPSTVALVRSKLGGFSAGE